MTRKYCSLRRSFEGFSGRSRAAEHEPIGDCRRWRPGAPRGLAPTGGLAVSIETRQPREGGAWQAAGSPAAGCGGLVATMSARLRGGVDVAACAATGPGTLAGRYLRRFWQPLYHAPDLLAGQAVPIRIL